jgi:hypothetical protein
VLGVLMPAVLLAGVATNPLYTALVKENSELRTAFLDSLSDLEKDVMAPGRQIRLWNGISLPPYFNGAAEKQSVDVDKLSTNPTDDGVNKLKTVPAEAGRCGDGTRRSRVPDEVTGRDLPRPLLLGLYAEPSWSYSVCWADARWSGHYTRTSKTVRGGGKFPPVTTYHYRRYRDLTADFQEWVTAPGHGKVLGRSTTMKRPVQLCYWKAGKEGVPAPDDCPESAQRRREDGRAGPRCARLDR